MAFHPYCYHSISFRLFRFQVKEDYATQYRKYHYVRSNTGNGKSDRVANNSCDNAHHGRYPFSQNRTFFATTQGVEWETIEKGLENEEAHLRAEKRVEAKSGSYIRLAVYIKDSPWVRTTGESNLEALEQFQPLVVVSGLFLLWMVISSSLSIILVEVSIQNWYER